MDKQPSPLEFWTNVWTEGTIGFHQPIYNFQMMNYFKDANLLNKSVLIPLAGKTKDILFFLEKGAVVTAVEFCEQAVLEFFTENEIPYTRENQVFKSTNLNFYVMDFFAFKTDKPFDVFYDRASQVVFNKTHRPSYYQQVEKLIDTHTTLFLAAIDHLGPDSYGPPFKISPEEVMDSFEKMNIPLFFQYQDHAPASEKMQKAGILTLSNYFLTNKKISR